MKLILFANTDWYLYNFRRSLALKLRDAGHEVLLISPPGSYGERLRALGLCWQPVPMDRRSLNPLREAALLGHLLRLLRRERPDLVHSFTIKCAVYGSLAARLAGVPARVNAVAGMGYVFTSGALLARLLRPVVRGLLKLALGGRNARLILQNPDDVALFEHAGLIDSAHVRLIPGSGVDCARFVPRDDRMNDRDDRRPRQHGHDHSRLRVLLPARLLWDKGLAEYAEAARLLHERGVPVHLMLAGEPDSGNPAAVPESTVLGWANAGLLEWLGHVEDMPTLLQSVDVVVLPSYREGLPKGLIEAAACGCALIATDVPGCREVIDHEVSGLLVPVRNATAVADAVERLAQNPELCARFGVAARAKAQNCFDEHIIVRATMAVYAEILDTSTQSTLKSDRLD